MSVVPTALDHFNEEALVRDHLHLVRRAVLDLAARMPRHAVRDDLTSAGMVGLAQAARSFDPSRGVPFGRYAATRIRGALLDELRANDWASRPVRAKARLLASAAERLTAELGREPTKAEVAAGLGIDSSQVEALRDDLHRAVVLNFDAVVEGEGDDALREDDTTPELTMLERERNAYLVDAIRALPERLSKVIVGYFFQDRPMQHIAEELGVTESRVSQLRSEALDLLREGLNSQLEPTSPADADVPVVGRVARRKAAYFSAIASSSTCGQRLDHRPRYCAADRVKPG